MRPFPQLFQVPRALVPVGSAAVFIRSWPAAGPGQPHRGVGGDPAVEGRVDDDRPAAAVLRDLDDGDAVTGLALADVIRVLRLPDTGAAVDDPAVDVLVVDGKDAAAAVVEQRHAVVVVTERPFLTGTGAARVLVERDRVRPHCIAPPGDDMPTVARRHGHRVEGIGRHRPRRRCAGPAARTESGARPAAPMTNAAAPHATAQPRNPRREIARSASRSKSVLSGRGSFISSKSSNEGVLP